MFAVGFINVALISFACLVVDSRLPPRPIGKLSSFVDFKVFTGKENRGYTLYVCGAGVVWLGVSTLHYRHLQGQARLTVSCDESESQLYTPIFYSEQYALFHHVSDNIAFYSLAMLNATSVFGRTIPNVRCSLPRLLDSLS